MARAAILGITGTTLTDAEATLFRSQPPAGVALFGRNVREPAQLRSLTAALRAVLPAGAVIMIDQEGGRVARLRPPHWRAHPAAGAIGALPADPAARCAWITGALIGLDCADAAIDVVCAPVLDLRVPGASDVVGDRSYGAAPRHVARLGRAMADGLLAAGVQPVAKHAPGHGRARVDSHAALPVLDLDGLDDDIAPFAACADLPWMMTAHLLIPALDPDRPATLSPAIIAALIRGRIGFAGALVSDDLGMGALTGDPADRATAALAAGCDVALYCAGDVDGNTAVLDAVPALTPAAQARLAAAADMARMRRIPLDPISLADERDGLLS